MALTTAVRQPTLQEEHATADQLVSAARDAYHDAKWVADAALKVLADRRLDWNRAEYARQDVERRMRDAATDEPC